MYPWLSSTFLQIKQRVCSGRLHHGLILQGMSGIGKATFASELAHFLLCHHKKDNQACGQCQACQLFAAQSHPDFHLIESEKQIGVDLIRDAIQKLIGKAQLNGSKVLIMFQADSMTEASANALLKTLEEPTDNTFLILVCDHPERLLPTILSRCEKIKLQPPSTQECIAWLSENGYTDLSAEFVKIYGNAPLLIQQRLSNDKALKYDEFLVSIGHTQTGQVMPTELAAKWQDELSTIVAWIANLTAKALKAYPESDALWSLQEQCLNVKQIAMNPGINKTLHISGILQNISHLKINLLEENTHAG